MKRIVFLTIFAYFGACFALVIAGNEAVNLCVYSQNPAKYTPKCFVCPTLVYGSALTACVNGTSMPNNISYSSATCMEKNCAINYPTAPPSVMPTMPPYFRDALQSLQTLFRFKRTVRDNNKNDPHSKSKKEMGSNSLQMNIVKQVESWACGPPEEENEYKIEVDYN